MKSVENVFLKMGDKLTRENNSELKLISFKEKDKPIEYYLDTLYKIDGVHIFGIIRRVSDDKRYLIDDNSIRRLGVLGYINNVVITTTNNTIRHHLNKVKAIDDIKDYTDVHINTVKNEHEFNKLVEELEEEFKYICVVDDKDIECISWLRLEPFGLIFDLSGNIAAILAKDEFNEYTIELKEFKRMYRPEYNLGHFSPRSLAPNFSRILSYKRLSIDEYNRIYHKLGEYHLRNFKLHESKAYYTGPTEKITTDLAEEIFSLDNLYYAIPNPEKFKSKLDFESSMHHAAYMGNTLFNTERYTVVSLDGVYTNRVKNLLLKRFDELKTGIYLNSHKDIADYVDNIIGHDKEEEYDWIVSRLEKFAELYNLGEYEDKMMKELGLKVANIDSICDIDEREEYVLDKIINEKADISLVNQAMHTPSLAEALDIFGLDIQLNEIDSNNKLSTVEDDTNSITSNNVTTCIDVINITDDSSVRLEVRSEDNGNVCIYIVIDNKENIRIDASEQSYIDYIKNGMNDEVIKKPLKRTLAILHKSINNIDAILDELM
ncbi:MAG: hypothetical protein J6A59_11345 [Lachnospiraceae bacterium]|nr:hypothetical protein [Lachnospiraceae bacterium]